MIAYFDSSALVPMTLNEAGTSRAVSVWLAAERVVTSRITYAEVRAALAAAVRAGRTSSRDRDALVADLDRLIVDVDLVEVTDHLVRQAGELCDQLGLRGCDAIQVASAVAVESDALVLVAGDRSLLEAGRRLGMLTVDTMPS